MRRNEEFKFFLHVRRKKDGKSLKEVGKEGESHYETARGRGSR